MDKDFDNSLGFVVHDVPCLLRWEFDLRAQELGLTRAQWSVLTHLQRLPGVQQVDLARVMDIKPITLARHLDKLEAKGRICRENDAQDRRAKRLHLTRKATLMIRSLKQVGKQVRKLALKNVSEAEFNTFMDLLFRMRANLGGKTY
ncbi:MAG: MarR family winged helix-turn-helix transcriptional regulator [Pseudohongiellaceae bacterium]